VPYGYRSARARILVLVVVAALSGFSLFSAAGRSHPSRSEAVLTASVGANSHWDWCNSAAVGSAPAVLWTRIDSATYAHRDLPGSFWSDPTYRNDIVRIVCYESTFGYHAENGPQYGWFQMNPPLIESEGVTWNEYWSGSSTEHPGWYQCTAGERYIHSRYGNPAVAWLHEEVYGWY
jgi:hypothetical protein